MLLRKIALQEVPIGQADKSATMIQSKFYIILFLDRLLYFFTWNNLRMSVISALCKNAHEEVGMQEKSLLRNKS